MTPAPGASYLALLRPAHTRRFFAAATTTRLSYATISLSLLLAVQASTGSYTAAGAALGAYGLPALINPLKARLIDRYGQARVLVPLSTAYSAVLTVTAAAAAAGTDAAAVYIALAGTAGLLTPPAGPVARGMWAALTAPGHDRQRAYSLDTVSEEVVFAVGPLLVGVLVALSGPGAALLATAALALLGSLALATTTLPPPAPAATPHHDTHLPASEADTTPPRGTRLERFAGPLSHRGFRWLAALVFAVGLGSAPLEMALIARALETGHPSAAGLLLAVLATASAVGGLAWGRRHHHRAGTTHLLGLLLATGSAAAGLAGSLPLLAAAVALAGLAVAPVFVVAYVLSDALVPVAMRTEGSTWVSTANNVGGALGAAAAGALIDHFPVRLAFLFGAAVLVLTATTLLRGRTPHTHH